MAMAIGISIGKVLKLDSDGDEAGWGRCFRVCVNLIVHHPLRKGTTVAVQGGGKVVVLFRYERLPDLCFICGCLDHQESVVLP